MKKKEFGSAIEFTERSLELFRKQNMQLEIRDNFEQLSNIYKQKKEFQKALDYHEKYSEIKEQLLNKEIVEKISNLQIKFDESTQKNIELKKYSSLISETLKKSMNLSFIGKSKKINEVMKLAMKAAKSRDTNVLITGESGTGKEIIAHLIHSASSRKDHLFVAVNSSSVPESLAESMFFGHIKGAFTDAINDQIGFIEQSHKGTLFLDEIAETPSQLQAKLLRVLENKMIKRLGSNNEIYVDFRIIAATNKEIDYLISENKFRLDLLHRINTIEINIPPLRERPVDIKPLLHYFVEEFSKSLNKPIPKINVKVIDKLKKYHFPGNVRELKNMVEKALILLNTDTLEPGDFNTEKTIIEKTIKEIMKPKTIGDMEIQMILDALKETNNNRTRAARLLGISHSTFLRKLKKIEK
ncbi:MAG: sigma-54 dependent transcriptional regulator [Candidatus Celaenobacter polaris]|nr:sigma-54 dependent transcriptional regulator [Candidatus Celaenobacter polaris]